MRKKASGDEAFLLVRDVKSLAREAFFIVDSQI
jgi:hypothetical protein